MENHSLPPEFESLFKQMGFVCGHADCRCDTQYEGGVYFVNGKATLVCKECADRITGANK